MSMNFFNHFSVDHAVNAQFRFEHSTFNKKVLEYLHVAERQEAFVSELLFLFVKKRIFVRNYWYENMSPVRSFAWKSSHFHVKRFAQALVPKKKQTATQKWK